MNSHSIWTKLDRYPPVLVRLLARTRSGRIMSDDEILDRAATLGFTYLDKSAIVSLTYARSWDWASVREMREFCLSCGVDFANAAKMRSLNRYLRNHPKFAHVKRGLTPEQYRELFMILQTALTNEQN